MKSSVQFDAKRLFRKMGVGVLLFWLVGSGISAWSAGPVRMDLFVLPLDATSQMLEQSVAILMQKDGCELDVHIYFLIRKNDVTYESPLGPDDFAEIKRQTYIREHAPDKLWPYLTARNSESYSPIWQHAAQWAGLDSTVLDAATRTVTAMCEWDQDMAWRHRSHQGPVLVLDGTQIFEGMVGMAEIDAAVRRKTGQMVEPIRFTILYDPHAIQSTMEPVRRYLSKYVPGAVFQMETPDRKSEQKLAKRGVNAYPVVLVDDSFKNSIYGGYFTAQGKGVPWKGMTLLPLPIDGDALIGRGVQSGKIQVIMQSHCNAAGELLWKMLQKEKEGVLKRDLLEPLYWIEKADNVPDQKKNARYGFVSIHGAEEIEEDVRRLALQKYDPDVFWEYIDQYYSRPDPGLDRSELARLVDPDRLGQIIEREGAALLAENYGKIKNIPAAQSPAVLVDNRYIINDLKEYFYQYYNITVSGTCP